jgi:dienelactone hydrolase
MGGSHGGTTTLATVADAERLPGPPEQNRSGGFAAAVALYPSCASRLGQWNVTRQTGVRGPITEYAGVYTPSSPVLILIGESDDWTPVGPCQRLVQTAREAGHSVEIKVYPGAHHSFDSPNPIRYVATRINPNSVTGRGATTGGDPAAWADSIRAVLSFFARYLQ